MNHVEKGQTDPVLVTFLLFERKATFYHGITEILADLDGTIIGVKILFYDTGKDNLLSIVPSIEFINGKFEATMPMLAKHFLRACFERSKAMCSITWYEVGPLRQ